MKNNILFLLIVSFSTGLCLAAPKKHQQQKATPTTEEPDPKLQANNPAPLETFEVIPSSGITPSAEEFQTIQAMQQVQKAQLKQDALMEQAQRIEEELRRTREDGWDTLTDQEAVPSSKPIPSEPTLLEHFRNLPQKWWEAHITIPNRIEHFMRYAGVVRTYIILLQKLNVNRTEFNDFIKDLNKHNPGEGHRWLDEALLQAIEDEREDTARKIMQAAIPYKQALPSTTRERFKVFLTACADKKRKALAADNEDYALDIHNLARIMREADSDKPEQTDISQESLERDAQKAALTLTQAATAGYLPRINTEAAIARYLPRMTTDIR